MNLLRAFIAAVVAWQCVNPALAEIIVVPNNSFESPPTPYVDTRIDSWQETAAPADYDGSGGFTWDQLTGVFLNTSPLSSDHIDNCDSNQAAYLFAVPGCGIFQDYDSMDWSQVVPSHTFNVRFEPGKSYDLVVGVIGGGGGMLPGASLELSLYYRDSSNRLVTVAASNVVHSTALFPTTTHLVDCRVHAPVVKNGDAWANKNIGMQILSTVNQEMEGGYWDIDNVRLLSTREPVFIAPLTTNGSFQCTLQSEPGMKVEIFATTNLALPTTSWSSIKTVTNTTGSVSFNTSLGAETQRFFTARQIP